MKDMTMLCAATLAAAFGAVESFRRGAQTVTPKLREETAGRIQGALSFRWKLRTRKVLACS